jgi:rhodanese-related sulfurtransferase
MTEPAALDPRDLLDRITSSTPPVVLDVRSAAEFAEGHVPGAKNIPFWAVPWRAGELGARSDTPIVVYCGHGPRAQLAITALRARGFTRVVSLAGHMTSWREAGLPVER